jgi:HK97 gp10 family phage protein
MSVKISITGIKEIDNVLRNLPKEITHQVLSSAHSAAAKPLVQRMQLTAPEGPTGNLVDSIGIVRSSVKKADNLGEIKVGPRRGRYKGHHAHMVEYGTKPRTLKGRGKYKSGTKRGVMPKKPFVKPAFRQTKTEVERGIAVQVGRALARKMKQLLK